MDGWMEFENTGIAWVQILHWHLLVIAEMTHYYLFPTDRPLFKPRVVQWLALVPHTSGTSHLCFTCVEFACSPAFQRRSSGLSGFPLKSTYMQKWIEGTEYCISDSFVISSHNLFSIFKIKLIYLCILLNNQALLNWWQARVCLSHPSVK